MTQPSSNPFKTPVTIVTGFLGGGKTTLLEVLTGIEPPDAGRVSHTSDLRMAVVTQRFDLPEELTIAQAIIEPLELETYEWASNAKVRDVLGGLLDDLAVTGVRGHATLDSGHLSGLLSDRRACIS